MISFIIPTRNRPDAVNRTLNAIDGVCGTSLSGAEVIVIDNASDLPLKLQRDSASGLPLRIIRMEQNIGAAARNIAAEAARNDWLIMLDDDSYPLDAGFIHALHEAPANAAAIGADVFLPDGSRERGGLPEVIVGCGAAVRREAFLAAGGYDPSFDYYAEEYDLCAKLLLRGWRVIHDLRFRVRHEKLTSGRDFDRIIHRLVRNNAWVAQRYAPDDEVNRELSEIVSRYAAIAVKECCAGGFVRGLDELFQTLHVQARTAMPLDLWDRFTGLSYARSTLGERRHQLHSANVAIVDAGKNEWAIRRALNELGATIVDDSRRVEALVIGTLSPGPMLDAFERHSRQHKPVICPWQPLHHAHEAACAA